MPKWFTLLIMICRIVTRVNLTVNHEIKYGGCDSVEESQRGDLPGTKVHKPTHENISTSGSGVSRGEVPTLTPTWVKETLTGEAAKLWLRSESAGLNNVLAQE